MKENMFYGAGPLIFKRAEELRNSLTPAEEILWNTIHINEWNVKFRRQHPIANYIVDFYCQSAKLVIEIDGGIHDNEDVKLNDEYREAHLKELGLTVLRFKNEEIFKAKKAVLETIANTLNRLNTPLQGMGAPGAELSPLYVIKIGGNIIDDEAKLTSFLSSFTKVEGKKILIHGGGKLATKLAAQLGVEQQMIDGRRITDAETLKIVTMVYAGYINKNIVAQLQANGCNAIGLCGADGNVVQAHKRPPVLKNQSTGERIDYGFVGDVDAVNTALLKSLLDQQVNVVLAPITHNGQGVLLNTNADTIAQEIAQAMSSLYQVHLIYSFEKAGVLLDANNDATVIPNISPAYYGELKEKQLIFAGMIPKLDNAFAALAKGVHRVIIGKAEELEELVQGTSGTSINNA
jgi:acetylglutamate kinase